MATTTETKDSSSPNVENKTNKSSKSDDENKFNAQSKQQVVQTGENNVLNSYRSITYNFTLAALTNAEVNKPDSYRNSELKFTILKSGGKGTVGISGGSKIETSEIATQSRSNYASRDPRRVDVTDEQKAAPLKDYNTEQVIEGFNKESPGRFDMFIENVEIDTLMAPSENSNASLATKISFTVIEPYSVNGFIEALYVASIAAGYPNYLSACLLLKMEFWGYPDGPEITNPEKISNADRYFPLGITGIEVEITERGTIYKVSAVPYNERAFGNPSVIKKPIKMEGVKVKEILEDFMKKLNEQVQKMDQDGKEVQVKGHDQYKIKFMEWNPTDGFISAPNNESTISKCELTELYRDNNLYKLADPATVEKMTGYKQDSKKKPAPSELAKAPESIKLEPNKMVIHFAENMSVVDVISTVIRDSTYVRRILKDMKPDEFGMITYFLIRLEVENQDKIDEVSKRPYQNFTYVVSPYRVHYTRVPSFGSSQVKESELKKLSLREYNYIYTGKNVDVLNFKLNFNTLFFEALPASMGNKDIPSSKTGTGPNNDNNVKTSGTSVERQEKNQVPLASAQVTTVPVQTYGSNAAQPLDSAYGVLAKTMHEAIINSKAAMLTGEIEILGDPMFIATNGNGNYNGKPTGLGKLINGEVNHLYGEVLITINFRNPIDIMPLESGGIVQFDSKRVPFSGVYRVIKATSSFKDGVFKQRLEIIRIPGQILDQDLKPTEPSKVLVTSPAPQDAVVPDTSRAVAPARRASDTSQLDKSKLGVPSIPTVGNLAGADPSLQSKINGAVSEVQGLLTKSAAVGQPLTNLASEIRLNASKLAGLAQQNLGSIALAAVAANVVTGNVPLKRAVGTVAGAVVGSTLASALKRANPGSGIGQGATVSINGEIPGAQNATAMDIKFGNTINPITLPTGSIGEFTGSLKNLGSNAIDNVTNTVNDVGKLVGGIGNNVTGAINQAGQIVNDITGNVGQIAGNIAGSVTGAVNQVGQTVNNIAGNVAGVANQVEQLANGIGDKISSLTASAQDPLGVAAKLGLNTAAISGLSAGVSKVFGQVEGILSSVPENVNLKQAVDNGLRLESIPAEKIKNIPATQPYSVAPDPIVEKDYVEKVVKQRGVKGLEDLYGVTSVSKLSANIVPDEIIKSATSIAAAASFNPLAALGKVAGGVDLSVLKDKVDTVQSQLSGLTNLPNIKDQNILGSVASKFGSATAGASPLDKLVSKLHDPNAPPYTGDDPIIRSRLGLPPLNG